MNYRDSHTCSNGQCIDSSSVCDGFADCLDGSDETENLCTEIFKRCGNYFNANTCLKPFAVYNLIFMMIE